MMNRRLGLCLLGGGLLAPALALPAALPGRNYRIGVLFPTWDEMGLFLRPLREAGYVEGHNLEVLARQADTLPQLELLARELVAARVELIAAASVLEAQAARRATSTVPIVMLYGLAPVELGLIESLARPGGNITGTVAVPPELVSKSIELFRELVPSLARLALIVDDDPWVPHFQRQVQHAASTLAIDTRVLSVASRVDLAAAFRSLEGQRPDGIVVAHSVITPLDELIRFAAAHKLPAMYGIAPAVRKGGLIALAPDLPAVMVRAAGIVDKILRGARPAETPMEQPTRFVLVVNRRVARNAGIVIPRSILVRATVLDS